MLISLYCPLFDAREFFPIRGQKTKQPTWPFTGPFRFPFQRNLGAIRPRPHGGVRGWIGESTVCEIRKSLRVEFSLGGIARTVVPSFARFFADASAAAQFSLGLDFRPGAGSMRSGDEAVLIRTVLKAVIRSRHRSYASKVADAGKLIADLYASGTTKGNRFTETTKYLAWGPPLLFIQSDPATNAPPAWARGRSLPFETSSGSLNLYYTTSEFEVPTFYVADTGLVEPAVLRFARIALARLYLELFCFERCLSILLGPTSAMLDEEGSAVLANRISIAVRRLTGRQASSFTREEANYAEITEIFSTLHSPGRIDELLDALEQLNARPNLRLAVACAAAPQLGMDRQEVKIYMKGGTLQMGNQYTSYGPVGAMGDYAEANHFTQVWQASSGSIDLTELATELALVQAAMKSEAETDEQLSSVGAVVEAKKAAGAKEGAAALHWLAKAGTWAFDIATKIGTGVAVAALKVALKL
jgi:hypothetical protein